MKGKKKDYFFAAMLVLLLLIFIVGSVILMRHSAAQSGSDNRIEEQSEDEKKESESPNENEKNKEAKIEIDFIDFSLLEPYFLSSQIEELKEKISSYITQEKLESVTKVVCKDAVTEKQKNIEFYCVLEEKTGNVLHVIYQKKTAEFELNPEVIPTEILNQERKEDTKQFIEIQPSEDNQEDGKLPIQWNYEEEDNTEVQISEKKLLEEKIPKNQLDILETEALEFLKENQEYRREISIEKETLEDTEEEVRFWGIFQNPRIDKKELLVVYDKAEQSYQFSLQVQEE